MDWFRDRTVMLSHRSVNFFIFTPFLNFVLTFFVTVDSVPKKNTKRWTTLDNGYLGSSNDEERSEMRYVMRIAEFSESSNLWTQIAVMGYTCNHASLSVGSNQTLLRAFEYDV
jgi:hypothetical protein